MTSNRRNVVVGATVLGSLIALGWLLLKFGASPARLFAEETLPISLTTDRADGIAEGSQVFYRGVSVGRVTNVVMATNQREVQIESLIDANPPLPSNVTGIIKFAGLLGANSQLSLELTGPDPLGKLSAGTKLTARFIGLDILPRDLSDLARDARQTIQQFRDSNLVPHLNEMVQKASKTVDSVNDVVGDEKLRADLKQSVVNVRLATESATKIGEKLDKFADRLSELSTDAGTTIKKAQGTIEQTQEKIDALSKQMTDRLAQASKLLDTFQSISTKIDQGKGTVGAMVNDPKLYESLVDTSLELKSAVGDIKRLIEQWEQEGVSLKMK